MSLFPHHRRHHNLLDHLPPPSVLPFLESVRAPEHACSVDYRRHHLTHHPAFDFSLPDFKTLLDDINGTTASATDGSSSLKGWNPLSAGPRSPNNQAADDGTEPIIHGGLGDDLLDSSDVFQPFSHDQWTLAIDDEMAYMPAVNTTTSQDMERRLRVEYLANKLNISPGQLVSLHQPLTSIIQSIN